MPASIVIDSDREPPLVVWGTSGHAAVVVDVVNAEGNFRVAGLIDDVHRDRHGSERLGSTVLGDSSMLESLLNQGTRHLFVAIGDNTARVDCGVRAAGLGFTLPALVHPTSHVGSRVEIGAGTVLMPHSAVNADAVIGRHVIVNTGAIVEHDCRLEDGVHIGPGAVVAGWTTIGQRAMIGAGAVVRDRITIGKDAVIGAGAVVVRDVPAGVTVVGVPARPL